MIDGKKILAIIPGRRGSQGCLGKNYKSILGMPLVLWSIQAACQSDYIDDIVVTTNDPKIIEIIEKFNAGQTRQCYIRKRPEEISGPSSSTEDAIFDVLSIYPDFDIIVLLQPTSPARRNKLIDKCIMEMVEKKKDSCFTASKITPFLYNNIGNDFDFMWMYRRGEFVVTPDRRPMRQNLLEDEFYYHDCGSVFVFYKKTLEQYKRRIGDNPAIISVDFLEALQIDTQEDFMIMEALADKLGGLL